MKKVIKKADKGIQIGKKKSTVSVTQDVDGKNVPFTGTVKENKRKAVMKVSNPDYGSTKTIEKFGRKGNLKSQTIFDRDASNKLSKVTRNKVDKEGNIQSSVPYQSQKKGGATKALPKAGPGKIIKAVATGIKKAGKTVKSGLTPDKGGYNPFKTKAQRRKDMVKDAVLIAGYGSAPIAGAAYMLNKDKKKKTTKPTKPKQLGPQSFAKGGIKTMVKTKKK